MIKIFDSPQNWIEWKSSQDSSWGSLGFVPTMGALHEGHLSLVRQAKRENDRVLVSLFVNPTQFENQNDLENYPHTLSSDVELLRKEGVDFVLTPKKEDLYPDNYRFQIHETQLSQKLCGQSRPGHFQGMLTVVLKLLNIAQAQRAYFGEKDFQQLLLVQDMVRSFFIPTQIIACPIVREESGLAMSSRNQRLSLSEREQASRFYAHLKQGLNAQKVKEALLKEGFEVDYVEDFQSRRFGAIRVGSVRLIDNVPL